MNAEHKCHRRQAIVGDDSIHIAPDESIDELRLLFIGDVVGRTGRRALQTHLGVLRSQWSPHLIVVNGENAAGGAGLTPETAEELFQAGADVITLGNHTWDHRSLERYLDEHPRLIRPSNFPPGVAGRGWVVVDTPVCRVAVINLMGRVFLPTFQEDPFRHVDAVLEELKDEDVKVSVIDFHAEATSEKQALAWYLDGRVSAIFGTHTHVQTNDARVLPSGTGYVTDVGMTGPWNSVIGVDTEVVVQRFLMQQPIRFQSAQGTAVINAAIAQINPKTGRCSWVTTVSNLVSN